MEKRVNGRALVSKKICVQGYRCRAGCRDGDEESCPRRSIQMEMKICGMRVDN
jgi:hypothetical protein